jgi:cytosine/adenosine deaminase-related metal-dependent hydrolase
MAGGDPARAVLTDEQAYVGALATYAEALLSGTTHHFRYVHPPAFDIGIRARGDRALCG